MKKGFTLVELILYMGLFSILLIIVLDLTLGVFNLHKFNKASSAVEIDSKYITQKLQNDLKRATAVVVPASVNTNSNTLQITVNTTNYTYQINSGNLQLSDGTNTYNLNSNYTTVSNLAVKKLGNTKPIVILSLNLQSNQTVLGGSNEEYNINLKIKLR